MKVKLLRDSRITHLAGEIVEVNQHEAEFLLSVNSAVLIADQEKKEEPKTTKRKTKGA